jgi:malonyl CoA-acyl carrier protein transacylase
VRAWGLDPRPRALHRDEVPSRAATAALFPGQGCSLQGAERLVREHCSELHERSRELIGCDPLPRASESTRFAQPAIYLASIAGWRRAREEGVEPVAFAGHSLGELSALSAAGVWSAQRGLELVVLRARLMAEASAGGDGGMLALLRASIEDARELAARAEVTVANDNAPGQVVLSGSRAALRELAADARERGLRTIPLDVSGAFHSPAMAAVAPALERAVLESSPGRPSAPVYSCFTGRPFGDVASELAAAICAPVRWRETVAAIDRAGAQRYLDVGPDVVIAGLVRRIVPGADVLSMQEQMHAAA